MQTLHRKANESIMILPSEDLDPSMTVAELFANGSIQVTVTATGLNNVQLKIKAPKQLTIATEENVRGCP